MKVIATLFAIKENICWLLRCDDVEFCHNDIEFYWDEQLLNSYGVLLLWQIWVKDGLWEVWANYQLSLAENVNNWNCDLYIENCHW